MYEYGGSLTENIPPPSSTMHIGNLSSVIGTLLLLGPDGTALRDREHISKLTVFGDVRVSTG